MTTLQIAKILRVAPRTVCKWIDSGKLKGFREASTGDRYVSPTDFRAFCEELNLCPECGGTAQPTSHVEDICGKCVAARLLEAN